jgi:hypothetical protein
MIDRTARDVMLVLMQSYPDKAVQREVLALLVQCSHQDHGCEWQGQIKEWEVCPLCVVVRPFFAGPLATFLYVPFIYGVLITVLVIRNVIVVY